MLIVSSREFREKQKSYLDKIDEGTEILIRRGKNKSYKITPVTEDDTLLSEKDFLAKIEIARAQYQNGEYKTLPKREDLDMFFDELEKNAI